MRRRCGTIMILALVLGTVPAAARIERTTEFAKGFHAGLVIKILSLAETEPGFLTATLDLADATGRVVASFSFPDSVAKVETAFAAANGETRRDAARFAAIARAQGDKAMTQERRDEFNALLYRLFFRGPGSEVKTGIYVGRGLLLARILLNPELELKPETRETVKSDLLYRVLSPLMENAGLHFSAADADGFAATVFSGDIRQVFAGLRRMAIAGLGLEAGDK